MVGWWSDTQSLVDGWKLAPRTVSTQPPPLWHLHPLPCRARRSKLMVRKKLYDTLWFCCKQGRRKSVFLKTTEISKFYKQPHRRADSCWAKCNWFIVAHKVWKHGNGACRATARWSSFSRVSQVCETENVEKNCKKTNAHTSLLKKKIGVFYWRRAQFLHHQSFRYGETHIL